MKLFSKEYLIKLLIAFLTEFGKCKFFRKHYNLFTERCMSTLQYKKIYIYQVTEVMTLY